MYLCEEARVKLMGKSELRNVEQTHNEAGDVGARQTGREFEIFVVLFAFLEEVFFMF